MVCQANRRPRQRKGECSVHRGNERARGAAGVFDGQDGLDQDLLCHAVNTFEVLYAALLKAQLALEPRSEQIDTENALREIRDARALVEDVPLQGRR